MNIGSALSHRLIDHAPDQLYNGRIIDILTVHILLLFHLAFFLPGILFQGRIHFRLAIVTVQSQHHTARGSHHRLHLQVGDDIDIVHGSPIHGVGHGYSEHVHIIGRVFKRQGLMFHQHTCRHKGEDILLYLHILYIHQIIMELITQCFRYIFFRGKPFIHQGLSQLTAAAFLQFQSLL